MSRLFYSVERRDDGKLVHIFGEVYQLGNGEEKDYRSAEFTGAYLEFEDIQESGGKFMEYIYNDGGQIYEKNMTEMEAEECCKTYFGGNAGTEFNIYECNQNMPCGDYWCEL